MTIADTKEKSEIKLQPPSMRKVILLNDDYTSDEFVVEILMRVFHMNGEKAYTVMRNAHTTGKAIAGVFPPEIAETKVSIVHQLAQDAEYPLQAITEEE